MANGKCNFHTGPKIFINENLTPMNEIIAYNCRKLRRIRLIRAYYSRNDIVRINENETSRPIKILHLDKLFPLFPDHFRKLHEDDHYQDVLVDTNSSLQSSY